VDTLVAALYPELQSVPPAERAKALRAARKLPFDALELLGIAVGLIVATLFLTHAIDSAAGIVARVLAACPVAILAIGPFVLRRTRRGLRCIVGRA